MALYLFPVLAGILHLLEHEGLVGECFDGKEYVGRLFKLADNQGEPSDRLALAQHHLRQVLRRVYPIQTFINLFSVISKGFLIGLFIS